MFLEMEEYSPSGKNLSFWKKRTLIEKCFFFITGMCLIIVIYLTTTFLMLNLSPKGSNDTNVCLTQNCVRTAGSILELIDDEVSPCDDFYKFACGRFLKKAIIPDDKVAISSMSHTSDKVFLQLMSLFEEPIKTEDPHSLKLVKSYYKSCMNTKLINEVGLRYTQKEFKKLGGWPVVEKNWDEDNFDWTELQLELFDKPWREVFFFELQMALDVRNVSRYIASIDQLNIQSVHLLEGFNNSFVQAMYNLAVDLCTLFGADRQTALVDMKEVLNLSINIAKLLTPSKDRKNMTLQFNPKTIREVQELYPNIEWLEIINNFIHPGDALTLGDEINIAEPQYFKKLNDFLPTVKKRIIANYMFFQMLRDTIDFMPEAFRDKAAEFERIYFGQKQKTPTWKECVSMTNNLNIAVSSAYLKKYFDKKIKSGVSELTTDIKNAFLDTLREVDWMDQKTKKVAILKAEKMGAFIGYHSELLDDNKVEDFYKNLNGDDFFLKLYFNVSQNVHNIMMSEYKKPIKRPDWRSRAFAYMVNAFYSQEDNNIEVPAAILQDNFFDLNRPQYLNYGAIGEVIGHEMTHGFDEIGRQYDQNGNLFDWWDEETEETFNDKSECLVDQYENYSIPEIDMSLNGVQTLGENIADNGGVKIAYKGYLKWLERNKPEHLLPGLQYSQKQLFWISVASNWCSKYKKEYLEQIVTAKAHLPYHYRVLVPLINSGYFANDFNCPLGSMMNPKEKCQVW